MKLRGERMKTKTWEHRQELIPDYKLDKAYTNEEISEVFDAIKNIAIKKYNLGDMHNCEIEETLFKFYLAQLENNKDELEKIIFLDYADNFMNQIADPLTNMLESIRPNTEFKDNQNLFKTRYELSKLNQNITKDSFNKYFCSLENGVLINDITNDRTPLEDDYLEELKDKEDNLFEEPISKDPAIRAKHYLKEGNYNPKYWKGYNRFIEVQHKNLIDYFVANDKIEEVESFRDIANIYYLYATCYKLTNDLNNKKGKTL